MANEATKTDLANLEKKINTKLQALVDSTNKALAAETAENKRIIEAVNKAFAAETAENNKIIDGVNKAILVINKNIEDLRTVINQHAKAINER